MNVDVLFEGHGLESLSFLVNGHGFCTATELSQFFADEIKANYLKQGSLTFYICVHGRLLGGKGGFGSSLRAQGGRMSKKKIKNFDSCRDLSGVRLRTAKQAAQLAEWIKNEPERKRKKDQEIQEKIEEALNPKIPKKIFRDSEYLEKSRKIVDSVEEAFQNGPSSSDESLDGSSSTGPEDAQDDDDEHEPCQDEGELSGEDEQEQRDAEPKEDQALPTEPLNK